MVENVYNWKKYGSMSKGLSLEDDDDDGNERKRGEKKSLEYEMRTASTKYL